MVAIEGDFEEEVESMQRFSRILTNIYYIGSMKCWSDSTAWSLGLRKQSTPSNNKLPKVLAAAAAAAARSRRDNQ